MNTTVENIQESRSLLKEFYDDLDSYQLLFEEEIMEELPSTNNDVIDNSIIDDLIELKEKFENYRSSSKNEDFSEGEETAFLSASEQVARLIKKFRKDYYG